MNTTLIQFPSGEETTMEDWTEAEAPVSMTAERDKFLLWEIRRSLMPTIGHLVASTQREAGHEDS